LKHRLLRVGSGPSPESTSDVTVHYRGWIPEPENPEEGLEFDSSYARGEPITFPVQGVIQGWIEGIQLMKTGGMIELEIPPDLGYGDRDIGDIPANSTLRFIIELLEVK
jgi:FKBP-type peptidyl-prolyl cis-trans isomerase